MVVWLIDKKKSSPVKHNIIIFAFLLWSFIRIVSIPGGFERDKRGFNLFWYAEKT